jgi:CMP-N-acetylneuraminic acid synthetase
MSQILALLRHYERSGSKGLPDKNILPIDGHPQSEEASLDRVNHAQ